MLRYNLGQTRQQGYAIDDEEYDYGVRCIAKPVYNFRDKLIGYNTHGHKLHIPLE